MQLVFDLDGCVVDNCVATRAAYREAGVTDFPSDWFHVSGWATEEQRRVKNSIYPRFLEKFGKILPVGRLLLQTGGLVLSGCSPESVDSFLRVFPEFYRDDIVICPHHPLEDKVQRLNALGNPMFAGTPVGLYFDDWSHALRQVSGRTSWKAIDASLL